MKMKLATIALFLLAFSFSAMAQKDVSDKSKEAIAEMKKTNDKITKYFNSAYGYAVFPKVGKGGMGLGGAHGKGLVFRGGEIVGRTSLTQFTVGFQLGGQVYQQVIFFENDRSYNDFTGGNFELSAQASAIAAAAGVAANAAYRHGVAIFTLGKGGARCVLERSRQILAPVLVEFGQRKAH